MCDVGTEQAEGVATGLFRQDEDLGGVSALVCSYFK